MRIRDFIVIAAACVALSGCISLPKFGAAHKAEQGRLERALEMNPANAHAAFSLGKGKLDIGEYSAAAKYFQRAIDANPKFEEAFLGLGVSLLEDSDFNGAEKAYKQLLAFNANSVGANEGLATIELERHNLTKARAYATSATALDPHAAQAIRVLGEIHYINGEYAEALAIWDTIDTDPSADPSRIPFQNDLRQYLAKYGER
jgi:tetratricopeptide (TPR) repeat protein